jgi:hypothetical protein
MCDNEKKIVLEIINDFKTKVDTYNNTRHKDANINANIQLMKDIFTEIHTMTNINEMVDDLPIEAENDIVEANHKKPKYNNIVINSDSESEYENESDKESVNDSVDESDEEMVHQPIPPFVQPFARGAQIAPQPVNVVQPFVQPVAPPMPPNNGFETDTDDDMPNDLNDEEIALRMQDAWNKPKKMRPIKKSTSVSSKYEGLTCEQFIKALLTEKVSG